jgi:hypothetical protein
VAHQCPVVVLCRTTAIKSKIVFDVTETYNYNENWSSIQEIRHHAYEESQGDIHIVCGHYNHTTLLNPRGSPLDLLRTVWNLQLQHGASATSALLPPLEQGYLSTTQNLCRRMLESGRLDDWVSNLSAF